LIPTQKIFLVCLPGSGKSTFGKQLTSKLGLTFIDLDSEIEKRESATIANVFASKGESYFRGIENKILKEIAQQPIPMVVATGGGTPCYFDAMSWMNAHGNTIYLNVEIDELVVRLTTNQLGTRPLFKDLNKNQLHTKLNTMLVEREMYYNKSQFQITKDMGMDEVIMMLSQ